MNNIIRNLLQNNSMGSKENEWSQDRNKNWLQDD